MKKFKLLLLALTGIVIGVLLTDRQLSATVPSAMQSAQFNGTTFENGTPEQAPGFTRMLKILVRWVSEERIDTVPSSPLPIIRFDRAQFDELDDERIHMVKLGHSSMLMKIHGQNWLIDPVFGERASPFSFTGPKRFQPTPIPIDALPDIDTVLVSHNHYDHLDKESIEFLANKVRRFLVPLGIDGDLKKWGVDQSRIVTFDWWQELDTDIARIVFTPARHFSGRGLNDRNSTLWGSWVIKGESHSVFYSGDSGYFDGFKTIGEKYGPFDLTLLEVGAYNRDWAEIHMFPEEAVQAHLDLNGRQLLPVHNSTFDLSFHPWYEPLERVSKAAVEQQVQLTTPIVGEFFTVGGDAIDKRWWKSAKAFTSRAND